MDTRYLLATLLAYDSIESWICLSCRPPELVCDWQLRELGGTYYVHVITEDAQDYSL